MKPRWRAGSVLVTALGFFVIGVASLLLGYDARRGVHRYSRSRRPRPLEQLGLLRRHQQIGLDWQRPRRAVPRELARTSGARKRVGAIVRHGEAEATAYLDGGPWGLRAPGRRGRRVARSPCPSSWRSCGWRIAATCVGLLHRGGLCGPLRYTRAQRWRGRTRDALGAPIARRAPTRVPGCERRTVGAPSRRCWGRRRTRRSSHSGCAKDRRALSAAARVELADGLHLP